MRECRQCGGARSDGAVARGPRPRFSRARVALFTTGRGSGMRGRLATVGTSAAGRLQRKELEGCAGTAAQQARDWSRRGESLWPLAAKGWERGGGCERLRRCGERTGRERGCCDRCCTAANGEDGGSCWAAALGSRKVCATGCATAEGAVRAQGVHTRMPEACRKKRGGVGMRCRCGDWEEGRSSQGGRCETWLCGPQHGAG